MSALQPYLPWLAWTLVPSLATDFTLKLLYTSSLLSRPEAPAVAVKHTARVRALLVGSYLVWSFYTTLAAREPSAYELLGVDLDTSVEQVKKAFRRMAMIYHPDKVGAQGERFFIALRRSHDVLSDPVKRFAYDRFGLGVLMWKDALSYREHMIIGLRNTLFFYLINPLIYIIISWLTADKTAFSSWHFTILFTLAVTEINLIIHSNRPAMMQILMPHTTVHEAVLILHQIYTSSTMAARQLIPLLASPVEELVQGPKTYKEAQSFLDTLVKEMTKVRDMANAVEVSTQQMWETEIRPICSPPVDEVVPVPSESSTKNSTAPSPYRPNATQERYARLASEALLLRSVENVVPDFRKRFTPSQTKELAVSSGEMTQTLDSSSQGGSRTETATSSSVEQNGNGEVKRSDVATDTGLT